MNRLLTSRYSNFNITKSALNFDADTSANLLCRLAHDAAKVHMNLKELAGLLNLSQATVSRALNGYPEVREATRQRVLNAARKYNYRPNARAMGLATGKCMAIGHVIPNYSQNEVVNPVFGEFITGASQTYSANGYELMLTIADSRDEEESYRNIIAKWVRMSLSSSMTTSCPSFRTTIRNRSSPRLAHRCDRLVYRQQKCCWISSTTRLAPR